MALALKLPTARAPAFLSLTNSTQELYTALARLLRTCDGTGTRDLASISFHSYQLETNKSQLLTIGTTALVTAAVTTFARNFISGEMKIKHRIAQRYGISDPQFERSMNQLMGPPILEGNLVTPLHNGAENSSGYAESDRAGRAQHHL